MAATHTLWKQEYLLDIDLIDEQHRTFFDICARIAQLCDATRPDAVRIRDVIHAIYDLRCYAFKHFHTEETLLAKHAYPGLFKHFLAHDAYLDSIRVFTADLEEFASKGEESAGGDFLALAQRINDYALDWWEKHIMQVDQQYAAFIRKQKGKAPRQP